jgi:hypothetical protein
VAQILAGTALLSGLYFTWRTLQVSREGQITERFTRAIDQLEKVDDKGNKLFEIRVGGIYALERIARESEEDHWSIMEILTAYVRQHAPWQPEGAQHGEEDAAVENSGEDSREATEPTEVPPPGPDIQAIMTVLRRRTRFFGNGEGEPEPLDLGSTHLREAKLQGANLYAANLKGANLQGANLQGAFLWKTNLYAAFLADANLLGAILIDANLDHSMLVGAKITDEQLANALSLQGAGMPDGQLLSSDMLPNEPTLTFEDWLRDREEHRKEAGQNE